MVNIFNKNGLTVLITGANGLIGTQLLNLLLEKVPLKKIIAIAKDKDDDNNLINYDKNIFILYHDITNNDDQKFFKILSEVDIIIHLAALVHKPKAPENEYFKVNHLGTKNLIESFVKYSLSKRKQFIFVSTVSVYGDYKSDMYKEDDICIPQTPYAKSKLLAEQEIQKFAALHNMPFTIFRPATIYCMHDKGNIGKLIKMIKYYHFFVVFGKGDNLKSFVYIKDVAMLIIKAIQNPNAYKQIFNVSAGPVTINEIINIIAEAYKIKLLKIKIPLFGFIKFLKIVKKLTINSIYSYDKASLNLGYHPISFKDGVKHIIND